MKKKFEKKYFEKNSIFLAYNIPRPPMSVSAQLVQLCGRL